MGFANRKRDDHGHVIGNDERDGQPCQHGAGGNKSEDKLTPRQEERFNKKSELIKKYSDMGYSNDLAILHAEKDMVENFDDDYEEEFNEPSPEDERQYVDKCMADIAKAADKKAFEYVSSNIDDLTEAGLISEETSDRLYAELDKKIDEVNNDIDKDLMDAINMVDDDVLDEQFGKDTPERKLVGAMKEEPKQKVKDIDGMKYPIDQDGNTSDDNKFPDENSLKDVYGENIEEENKPDEQKLNKFSEELKKIGINNVKLENNNIHEAEDGIGISATSRKQLNDWQEKLQKAGYKAKLEWIPGLGGRLVIKR